MKVNMNMLRIMDKTGSLRDALRPLRQGDLNINFLSATSIDGKYGLIYLLPKQPTQTLNFPKANVVFGSLDIEVILVTIKDEIGALIKLLDPIADAGVYLNFCFAFSTDGGNAVAILGVPHNKLQKVQDILSQHNN